MTEIILWMLLACAPAYIARTKGHGFWTWWFYGFFLLPVAFLHSLVVKHDFDKLYWDHIEAGEKECPNCYKFVDERATRCHHCHCDL